MMGGQWELDRWCHFRVTMIIFLMMTFFFRYFHVFMDSHAPNNGHAFYTVSLCHNFRFWWALKKILWTQTFFEDICTWFAKLNGDMVCVLTYSINNCTANPWTTRISLFRNKRFALNEMFQQNASKFAIFYVYENPCSFFRFSFRATLGFT